MTTIKPTVTDEMIERGREAREGHYLRVAPVSCTCGWRSDTYIEADGLPRYEAHLVELALEAVAPLIAAHALKAVLELHRPVDVEPSDTICGECSLQLPNGRYFGKIAEWPCPTVAAVEAGR